MGISLRPEHLRRYRDIARLLFKYGRSDLVRTAGLEGALEPEEPAQLAPGAPPPDELAADLERLGPTFIKLGQLLSTRPDLLPEPYLDALSRLQDQVAPVPFAEIEAVLEAEIEVRLSRAFPSFDHVPLASASLGQVHRAELRDGRPVAVKVQRPHVRERIADDLDALADIAGFLDGHTKAGRHFRFGALLEEFRRSLGRELDYRREAQNMLTLGRNLAEFERILVPRPVDDLTTGRVLTMDLVRGRKVTGLGPLARLELEGEELADELFAAYLKQILNDGFFHADPHPGNVFITPDHRLALIDIGMVAHVSPDQQQDLIQLLLAVSEGRSDVAARCALHIGERTDEFDQEAFTRRVEQLIASNREVGLDQLQVGRVMLELTRVSQAAGVRMPPELSLLGKALLNLDEVARILEPAFDPNAALQRHAGAIFERRFQKSLSPGSVLSGMLEMKDFAERLPGRVNRILDAVANNDVEIKVHALDEAKLMSGFQKIANRITAGLLLASLIIGAAMLMQVSTPFRILGYPGLAVLFFAIAAAGGIWLLFTILRETV